MKHVFLCQIRPSHLRSDLILSYLILSDWWFIVLFEINHTVLNKRGRKLAVNYTTCFPIQSQDGKWSRVALLYDPQPLQHLQPPFVDFCTSAWLRGW